MPGQQRTQAKRVTALAAALYEHHHALRALAAPRYLEDEHNNDQGPLRDYWRAAVSATLSAAITAEELADQLRDRVGLPALCHPAEGVEVDGS